MTKKELLALREKASQEMPYFEKALERDSILFNWKSNTPGFKLPFMPEQILTLYGTLGYDLKNKRWVTGEFNNIKDEYGDYKEFVSRTLDNIDVKVDTLINHKEVVVCGNTPLYRDYNDEREFYAYFKRETDKSIFCQLINSRLNKAIVTDSDNKKKQIEDAYAAVKEGKPVIFNTDLLSEIDTIDLTDPDDIEKMQYLSSFYQTMEKREANDYGIDLEQLDKRAQVSTEEINQYGDVTTLEYLEMYEMRKRFMEEMKENGFDIEIVRNPVFFDEPTSEDIDEGTFEEAEKEEEASEAPETPEAPEAPEEKEEN